MEPHCNCPHLQESDWHLHKHVWGSQAFYLTKHRLLFHMPIGIRRAITKGMNAIQAKGYTVEPPYMMLDEETGPFSANMLIAIKETPKDNSNVVIWEDTTLYSRFYHGPFRGLKHEVEELIHFVEGQEKRKPTKIYSWVSNCPECWKREGGPTTVLFARV